MGRPAAVTSHGMSRHGQSKHILFSNMAFMPIGSCHPNHACRHLAAAEGQLKTVEWLLKQGCDPNPVDRFSRTPLDVSSSCPSQALLHVLCVHCPTRLATLIAITQSGLQR